MRANDLLTEMYDPAEDHFGRMAMDDTRRPRLTLHHLQRLRKARDVQRYEKEQHLLTLPDIYSQPTPQ